MSLTTLNPAMLIVIVGVVLVIGVALWVYVKYMQKNRTKKLRSKFGPEYDKAISEHQDRGHAELERCLERRVPPSSMSHPVVEERSRYNDDWERSQSEGVLGTILDRPP